MFARDRDLSPYLTVGAGMVRNDVKLGRDTSDFVAVGETGCTLRGAITLTGVRFEYGSAVLSEDSKAVLDRLAADLKKYPRLVIELQGHTNSIGSEQYNLRLSQQRAEAVRLYLVSQGVGRSQIVARGYGESQPVADNGTAEGRARNRRVVMMVLQNPGDVEVRTQ